MAFLKRKVQWPFPEAGDEQLLEAAGGMRGLGAGLEGKNNEE